MSELTAETAEVGSSGKVVWVTLSDGREVVVTLTEIDK